MGRTGYVTITTNDSQNREPPPPPSNKSTKGQNICAAFCCAIFIILLISLFSSVPTYSETGETGEYQLSYGEQYMKYTGSSKVKAEFNRNYISAYEKKRGASPAVNVTTEKYVYGKFSGNTSNAVYTSYFVTPYSYITIDFKVDDNGKFIVIRGEEQFKKFKDGRYYSSVYSATGSGTFTTSISVFEEYFVVINPTWYRKNVSYEYTTTIDRTSYDVTSLKPICRDSQSSCVIGTNSYAVFTLNNPRTKNSYKLSLSASGSTIFGDAIIAILCTLVVVLIFLIVLLCLKRIRAKNATPDEEKGIISSSDAFVADPNRTVVVIDDNFSGTSSSINSSFNGTKGESDPFLNSQATALPPSSPATLSYGTMYPPPPAEGQYPPHPASQQQSPMIISYVDMPTLMQNPAAFFAGQYQPAVVEQNFGYDYPVAPPPPGTVN